MNDRYLFRAKRTDNVEWVEGDLVHSVYKINDTCVGKYCSNVGMHQVDESTVCQCTGLKDKNGKLIWENDVVIIKYDDDFSEVGCIKYSNCGVRYNFVVGTEIYSIDDSCDIEVIGNIFDNPGLMNE